MMCKVEDDRRNKREGNWKLGMSFLGEKGVKETMFLRVSHGRMKLWTLRAITTLLLWTCIIQLVAIGEVWGPRVLKNWPSCSNSPNKYTEETNLSFIQPKRHLPPKSEILSFLFIVLSYCFNDMNGIALFM